MSDSTKLRTKLAEYPFPQTVLARVSPFVAMVEAGKIDQARATLGQIALKICEALRSNSITPKEADQVFTLLDVYLSDNYPDLDQGSAADELIFEGQFLHHYGDEHGSDLEMMEQLARQLIDGQ